MFGSSSPFGQSSSSPFGQQSVFGQNNNANNNNPFAPKPFGSTNPFGSQTGSSLFGGTSTGVFGAASAPAFGSTTPTFGASSTPAFGSSQSSFGSTAFGQKPAFGGFGSTTPQQSSPFGSSFPQSQPAFSNNLFGSTSPFGASSTPAFGAATTPAFGATTTPAFGATTAPAFGSTSTPAFGATTSAFGSSPTPTFGNTGSAFGTSIFGASSAPAFGNTNTNAFSTPAFGSTASTFGSSSSPSFNFGSSPAFGQSTSAFGSSPFGSTSSPFGAQTSQFGAQPAATPTFASSGFGQNNNFGGQRVGSRVAPYTATPEQSQDGSNTQGKLESISAMAAYKEKCHEELRWEDYQAGDKGGPNPAGQPSFGATTNPTQSSPFATSSTFGQTAPNSFSSPALANTNNIFGSKSSPFGTPTTPSPFGQSTQTSANPFGTPQPSQQPSLFGTNTAGFGSTSSAPLFTSSTSAFGSTSSLFGTGSGQGSTPAFNTGFGNTGSSSLFGPTTSLGQSTSAFGQTGSSFGQTGSTFGQTSLFSTPNTGFPSMFSTTPSQGFGQATPTLSTPFQSAQPTQSAFGFGNYGQTQPAPASNFGGTPSLFGQNNFGQTPAPAPALSLPTTISNPFGTLPAMPQMSIGRSGTSPSVQYGISSLPVVDKPAPVRISSLLTSRHISQRRIRLPARKYNPKTDGQKVAFFSDEDDVPSSTPKADALFVPRENPRALVIRPLEQWPSRNNTVTTQPPHENGKVSETIPNSPSNGFTAANGSSAGNGHTENGHVKEKPVQKPTPKSNGIHDDLSKSDTSSSYKNLTNHRAGEAAIVYEHGADIEALMPKLRRSDYYTEPRIQELAAKERADPGFTRHVTDFVIGRHGYGSIKFLGQTDVRCLDLESLVQFNNREVIVYMDETKKPPVGQGLNKAAEVTLLKIKCFDKKSGTHITEGPGIEKYKELLKKKAADQGAEFVSYDPVKGEWKFRVDHFSTYKLDDEDEYEEEEEDTE